MREKLKDWMLVGAVCTAIALFPLGATVFHFLVRASLATQQTLDTDGVPVTARLVNKEIEREFHSDRRVGISQRGGWTEVICHVEVEYSVAGSKAIHHQTTELDDRHLCERLRVGDTIPGRALSSDPEVMLLEANRVSTYWYWVSLFLMVAFIAGPVWAVIKLTWGRDKSEKSRKPDDTQSAQSSPSVPSDLDVRD